MERTMQMRKRALAALLALALLSAATGAAADGWTVDDGLEDAALSPDPRAQARMLLQRMDRREKIYQLFIVTPEALTGEERTSQLQDSAAFSRYPVGGVLFFGQNIVSESQFSALIQALRDSAAKAGAYPPFLAVDEEGGNVSRVANKLGYPLPASPEALGEAGDAAQAQAVGTEIAAYLKALGLNLDFAPVADVLVENDSEVKGRSYGAEPQRVSALSAAMAQGLRAGGVIPCYKHFPGHGATAQSAHAGKAASSRALSQMLACELIPFQAGIDAGIEMIMISHMTARGLDASAPASLSRVVITTLLREEMGYDGVVITDALRMEAITERCGAGEAAVSALLAGADILLLPEDLGLAAQGIETALLSGRLTEARLNESVERILALKIQAGMIQ